jgi:short-subunit dehydrogenase
MKTTLITGASSGIGEEFARRCAARGENLLLAARSAEKLQALCAQLAAQHKVEAQFVALDLSAPDAPQQLFTETEKRGLEVETLVNNAGFGAIGDFATLDRARQLNMIDLNVRSLVELAHLFLPAMRARKRGAIINVASVAAFQGVPFFSVYAATKAFVLSFSEALAEENRAFGVKVLALCPGATETNFFEAAHAGGAPKARGMQTSEEVVTIALDALAKGKRHTVCGWANRLMIFSERFAPRRVVTGMARKAMEGQYGKQQ